MSNSKPKKGKVARPSPSVVIHGSAVIHDPVTFGQLRGQKVEVSPDRGPAKILTQRAPIGWHDQPELMRTEFKNVLPSYRRG